MRIRTLAIPMAVALTVSATATATAQAERTVARADVEFRWRVSGGLLHGCMRAATRGWITVGFNTTDGLSSARLVMGRLVNGHAQAQVHMANPPQHTHRPNSDGSERVSQVQGSFANGHTQLCFSMPLKAQDAQDLGLAQGQTVHLILAWSHETDFDHHSAQRGAVAIVL